jgi:hypothetical protein
MNLWTPLAEGEGFEPSIRFPVYTRSRRAPSTARPPLRTVPMYRRSPAFARLRQRGRIRTVCNSNAASRRCCGAGSILSLLRASVAVPVGRILDRRGGARRCRGGRRQIDRRFDACRHAPCRDLGDARLSGLARGGAERSRTCRGASVMAARRRGSLAARRPDRPRAWRDRLPAPGGRAPTPAAGTWPRIRRLSLRRV